MELSRLKEILLTISDNVHHLEAPSTDGDYIVWAEESEAKALYADNMKIAQIIVGTLDLFTKKEYDPLIKKIQDTFNEHEITFKLISVQYERDTKYTHYEWEWEVDSLG